MEKNKLAIRPYKYINSFASLIMRVADRLRVFSIEEILKLV